MPSHNNVGHALLYNMPKKEKSHAWRIVWNGTTARTENESARSTEMKRTKIRVRRFHWKREREEASFYVVAAHAFGTSV
jgi:hypothetical protein